MYNITARRPGAKKSTCIRGIQDDDRAEQLVRAMVHEGFRVTIEEDKNVCPKCKGAGAISELSLGPSPVVYRTCPTCEGHGILAKPMDPPIHCAVD